MPVIKGAGIKKSFIKNGQPAHPLNAWNEAASCPDVR